MSITKKLVFVAAAWFVLGCICGFFMGKARYDKPIVEKVERDTVIVVDTIPQFFPKPVEVEKVKTEYRYLTRVENRTDTVTIRDEVLVEVPIESKHYQSLDYDAYVSGYMANLDSIRVYKKTEYITETITRMKPPNKWELDIVGGINYEIYKKKYTPYALGELLYKPNRLQFGIQGGVVKTDNKAEPIVGGKIKIRLL